MTMPGWMNNLGSCHWQRRPAHAAGRARIATTILLAVSVIAVAGLGALGLLATRPQSHWLVAALTGRVFMVSALVFVVCLLLTIVLCSVLWQAGKANRIARRTAGAGSGEHGAAIVEFALVLPFLLMLSLLMAQSALLMAGNIAVNYSAFCAARAAVVNVPLDLNDEPRNTLPAGGTKFNRVRDAAIWAVTPVSCGSQLYPAAACDDLRRGIDSHLGAYNVATPAWVDNSLPHRLKYAQDHTLVSIREPENGDSFQEHEDVVADVSHTFYLGIPFAGRVLSGLLGDDGRTLSAPAGGHGVMIYATSRLPNEGAQDFVDIERFDDWTGS